MKYLEYTFIALSLTVGIGFILAGIRILFKMKTSKDGIWRP